MDNDLIVLSLVALTVLASGCTDNGGEEGQESPESIEIHSLEVEHDEVFEGNPVSARLELANSGNIPGSIDVGEDGSNVFKDYCPDVFQVSEDGFQVSPQTNNVGGTKYKLPPGAGLTLQWNLRQKGDVPLYGKRCSMEFEVPFNYSVSAYRQIQVKKDRTVEGSDLNWESSSGPLLMAIEPIGGSGEEGQGTFIQDTENADENKYIDSSMDIQIQLRNTGQEGFNKGVIDINQESFEVSFELNGHEFTETMDSPDNCEFDEDRPIRMFEGQSRVITCRVDLIKVDELQNQLSAVGNIETKLNYTYLKDAGTRKVEVKYSG